MTTPTHYLRSDGTSVAIAEMPFPHLSAAVRKLADNIEGRPERVMELEVMKARLAVLTAEFDAKVAGLKRENFSAHELGALGWIIIAPLGSQVTMPVKTEAAAWAKLIASREGAE